MTKKKEKAPVGKPASETMSLVGLIQARCKLKSDDPDYKILTDLIMQVLEERKNGSQNIG